LKQAGGFGKSPSKILALETVVHDATCILIGFDPESA